MDLAQPQELTATIMVDARLTPDLVGGASFRPARLGRRGLDEAHVRAFCRQVESELVILTDERRVLQDEVLRLRRRVLGQGGEDDADSPGNAHVQAVSILSRAQQTASHYVSEAQEYSRHLAQDARRRRDEMLAEAREQADQLRAEGREHADQARAQARLEMVHAQAAHRDRARAVTGPQRRR
jgi:cell division septum initiation protein DivIVA